MLKFWCPIVCLFTAGVYPSFNSLDIYAVTVLWLRGRLSFTGCTLYLFFVDRQPISSLLNLDLVRLLLKKIIYVYNGLYLKLSL